MEYKLLKVYRQIQRMGVGHAPTWKRVEMVDLRKGDTFVMVNPDGTLVEYKGEIILYAMSNAFLDEQLKSFVVDMTSLKEWREAK
ncbi:hypothetical protein CN367_11880 [Priestia megaterium]|uniref:hypothetical protein n=1 Tax=Priestia megaterium TaxID=1404 RepID=UPI000BF6CC18|nr:hypothetical protein [Priestia megaterium]PEZ47058.1 hypothetical protein CN367_11880 [Priestia megaterium]